MASLLIAAFTALNCFGVGRTAKVQNVLTSTKMIVVVGFVAARLRWPATGSWSHFSEPAVRTSTLSLPTQFVVSLLWVMFGYSGWNAATYVAEEVRQPERTLPARAGAGQRHRRRAYLALNVVFIYATPLEKMKGVIAIGSLAASNLFGPNVAGVFSRADGDLHRLHRERGDHHRAARVLRDGQEPGVFQRGGRVHPRWHTPVVAIVAQGACAMLMTLTPFPQLVLYIGMSLTLFTVLSVASLFVFRRRNPGWQRLRALDFAWPLIPASYILVGTAMMVYGVIWQPWPSLTALARSAWARWSTGSGSGRGDQTDICFWTPKSDVMRSPWLYMLRGPSL